LRLGDSTARLMPASPRAFVRRHTRLRPVPSLVDMRLHLADEVYALWRAVTLETGDPDPPFPYWAFAWTGGLALSRYLQEHPEVVAGRRVFDFASGSGLCAIAALRAGALTATAADIDVYATEAIGINARANGCRVSVVARDVLDDEPPDADLVLAGDCWYDEGLAARILPWLLRAHQRGIEVLVGDNGRRHLPIDALVEVASYEVPATTELEDLEPRPGRVFRLRAAGPTSPEVMAEPPQGQRSDAQDSVEVDHEHHGAAQVGLPARSLRLVRDNPGAGLGVRPHDADDIVNRRLVDADHHGGVRLAQEPARAVEARRAVLAQQQRVDDAAGIIVVHDRDHQLHRRSMPQRF